jgi:hypothetical protein
VMQHTDELRNKIKSLEFHSATAQVKQVIESFLGPENAKKIVADL